MAAVPVISLYIAYFIYTSQYPAELCPLSQADLNCNGNWIESPNGENSEGSTVKNVTNLTIVGSTVEKNTKNTENTEAVTSVMESETEEMSSNSSVCAYYSGSECNSSIGYCQRDEDTFCAACSDYNVTGISNGPCKEAEIYLCPDNERNVVVCPAIFLPVCGFSQEANGTVSFANYSSGCQACNLSSVGFYLSGACNITYNQTNGTDSNGNPTTIQSLTGSSQQVSSWGTVNGLDYANETEVSNYTLIVTTNSTGNTSAELQVKVATSYQADSLSG